MVSKLLGTALGKLQRNDPVGAQRILDRLPAQDQNRADVQLLRGLVALAQDDAARGLKYLGRAQDLRPGDPVITQNLVIAILAVADDTSAPQAIARYEQALELDPANERALLGLAQSLQETCDYNGAAELYQAYLSLHSDNVPVLIGLGYCLQELRRPEEARGVYDTALALDPAVRPLVLKSLSTASAGSVSLASYDPTF